MNIITYKKTDLHSQTLTEQESTPIVRSEIQESPTNFYCNHCCFESKVLHHFFENKIINIFGEVCLEGINEIKLPNLQKEEIQRLEGVLCNKSLLSHPLSPDFIEVDLDTLPQLVHKFFKKNNIRGGFSRELVGGIVKYILGLSYYKRAFEAIGMEHIFANVPQYIMRELSDLPGDVDQKIYVPRLQSEELSRLDHEIKNYFVRKIQKTISCYHQDPIFLNRQSHFFRNYKHIKEEQTEFLIVSFGAQSSQVVDNSIVRKHANPFLFGNDAIFLTLPGYIDFESHEFIPGGACHNGWQSLVSFITKTVFSPEPEKVNQFGWLRLISHFTKGYTTLQPHLERTLQNTYLKQVQDSYTLALQMINVLKSHHQNDSYSSAIIFLCNAFVYLSESYDDNCLTSIATTVLAQIDNKMEEKHLLINWLEDALISEILPFKTMFSYIVLLGNLKSPSQDNIEILERSLSGDKGLQFRFNICDNLQTLLIPKNIESAWNHLLEFSLNAAKPKQIEMIDRLWYILGSHFNLHTLNKEKMVETLPFFEFPQKRLIQTNKITTAIGFIYQLLNTLQEKNIDFILKIYRSSKILSNLPENFQKQYISLIYEVLNEISDKKYLKLISQREIVPIKLEIAFAGMQTQNAWIQKQLLTFLHIDHMIKKNDLQILNTVFDKSEKNLVIRADVYRSLLTTNKVVSSKDLIFFAEVVEAIMPGFAQESIDVIYRYVVDFFVTFRSIKNKSTKLVAAIHMQSLFINFKVYSQLDLKPLYAAFIEMGFIQYAIKNANDKTASFLKDLLEVVLENNSPKYIKYKKEIIHYFEETKTCKEIKSLLKPRNEHLKNVILDLIQSRSLEESLEKIKVYIKFLKETDLKLIEDHLNLFIEIFFNTPIENYQKKSQFILNFYSIIHASDLKYFFEKKYFSKVISLANSKDSSLTTKNLIVKILTELIDSDDFQLIKNINLCQMIIKNMDDLIKKEVLYSFVHHFLKTFIKNKTSKIDESWFSLLFQIVKKTESTKQSFNIALLIDALLKNNNAKEISDFIKLFTCEASQKNYSHLILRQLSNRKNSSFLYLQLFNKLSISKALLLENDNLCTYHHRSIFSELKKTERKNLDVIASIFLKGLVWDEKCWENFSTCMSSLKEISLITGIIDKYIEFITEQRSKNQPINEDVFKNISAFILCLKGLNLYRYFLRIKELVALFDDDVMNNESISAFFECFILRFTEEALEDSLALNYVQEQLDFITWALKESKIAVFRPVIYLLIVHRFLEAKKESTQEAGLLILENVLQSDVDTESARFTDVANIIIKSITQKFVKHEKFLDIINMFISFVVKHQNPKLNLLTLFDSNPDCFEKYAILRTEFPLLIKNIEYINQTGLDHAQVGIIKTIILMLKEFELYDVIEHELFAIEFQNNILTSLKYYYIYSRLHSIMTLKNILCMDSFERFVEFCCQYFSEMHAVDDSLIFENFFSTLLFRYGNFEMLDHYVTYSKKAINSLFGSNLPLDTCFENYLDDITDVCKKKKRLTCLNKVFTDWAISLLRFHTAEQDLNYPMFLMRFTVLKKLISLKGINKPVMILIKEFVFKGFKSLNYEYANLYTQHAYALDVQLQNANFELTTLLLLFSNQKEVPTQLVMTNKKHFENTFEDVLSRLEEFNEFYVFECALRIISKLYPYLFCKNPEWEKKIFTRLSLWLLKAPHETQGQNQRILWKDIGPECDRKFMNDHSIQQLFSTKKSILENKYMTTSTKLQRYFSFFYENCSKQYWKCEGLLAFVDCLQEVYDQPEGENFKNQEFITKLIIFLIYTVEKLEFPTPLNINALYKIISRLTDHFVFLYKQKKEETSLDQLLCLILIFCSKKYENSEQRLKYYAIFTRLLFQKLEQ